MKDRLLNLEISKKLYEEQVKPHRLKLHADIMDMSLKVTLLPSLEFEQVYGKTLYIERIIEDYDLLHTATFEFLLASMTKELNDILLFVNLQTKEKKNEN